MMENNRTIQLIKQSNRIPKIPKTFGEILNMLFNPYDYDMNSCIEKLSKQPQLESTLIKVLNSNFKIEREIVSIKDAVTYLGAKNARIIAISHITRILLPDRKGRTQVFNTNTYWKHCLGTSIASSLIANETGLSDKNKMFTIGLIHDIGVTVLDICLPEYLDEIYIMQKKGSHQIVAEKIVLGGITHAEIGLWLCKEWGLPDEIAEIVGFHHTPFLSKTNRTEVEIMHLGDAISTNYYEKLLGNETTFILLDRIMESLGVTKKFVDEIIEKLPKEVQKVNRTIDFKL